MLALPLLIASQKPQQETKPQYNVRVNLVSLDVEVLDALGNPVLGLTQKDFQVKENGKPVEISHFLWQSDRPVSLAFVLDTSAISSDKLVTAKWFIIDLAHVLGRSDELCLYSFDARDAYLEQDLTSSRGNLVGALENIGVPSAGSGGIMTELFGPAPRTGLGIDLALRKLRSARYPKRALLLVSNRFRGLGPATVEHVQKSGCTLLTLGFDNEAALWITLGGDQVSKNQLIKDSGGRRFSAETPDMSGVCRQIAYALKNYYVLGYMTDTGTEVKNPQKIEVSVPGKNYTLHYRRTFVPQ